MKGDESLKIGSFRKFLIAAHGYTKPAAKAVTRDRMVSVWSDLDYG